MGFVYNSKEIFLQAVQNHSVICFGAGILLEGLLREGEDWLQSIECILDNNISKQGNSIAIRNRNIIIENPNILAQDYHNSVILITCRAIEDIREQLQELGVCEQRIFSIPFQQEYPYDEQERKKQRMVVPSYEMLDRYFQIFHFTESQKNEYKDLIDNKLHEDGMVLPYVTALVTSKCTLRCKDCCNLMPYCNQTRSLSKERIIADINRISKYVDFCVCMNITGGEPLLHENIDEIISAITTKGNILFVELITNGTVIPPQGVLNSLKNDKLVVRISKYLKYSKIEQLTKIFQENGIRYIVKEEFQWNSPGGISRRNKEHDRIKYEYLACWAGMYCKSIWDGNLYACARAAYLHEIGISNDPSDLIELSDDNFRERLLNFYLTDYVDACDFCDMENKSGVIVEPAIQAGR